MDRSQNLGESEMAADAGMTAEQKVAFYIERAGVRAELVEMQRLVKSLAEMETAGRQVRQGLERNDELAIAFQPPVEKQK
jgi:hypothetical protein